MTDVPRRSRRPAPRQTGSRRPSMPQMPKGGGSDLGARIAVAVPAIAVALVLIVAGEWWFAAGAIALGLVCIHELLQMSEGLRPVRIGAFLGVIALGITAHLSGQDYLVLVLFASIPVVFLLGLVQVQKASALGIAFTIFGIAWIGLGLAHGILLRDLPHGAGVLVDVLAGTFVGDTAAYLGGRALGHHKLAPTISPNKTIEGLAIGMAGAVFAVWFAGLYQDWMPGTAALALGVAVAIAAPLGDLFESYFKREAQTKDTGKMFGAHGGALDRLDAVLFTCVAGYYVWLWVR